MTIVACRMMSGLLVALLVLSGTAGLGYAQQAPAPAPAPVKTPKLDAEALKIPDNIHDTGAKKLTVGKTHKALPPPSLPNKFDLGTYDLEFKAGQTSDVNPRTGFDSGEKANLSNTTPGRKSDPALPNYFGLKLSAPVR